MNNSFHLVAIYLFHCFTLNFSELLCCIYVSYKQRLPVLNSIYSDNLMFIYLLSLLTRLNSCLPSCSLHSTCVLSLLVWASYSLSDLLVFFPFPLVPLWFAWYLCGSWGSSGTYMYTSHAHSTVNYHLSLLPTMRELWLLSLFSEVPSLNIVISVTSVPCFFISQISVYHSLELGFVPNYHFFPGCLLTIPHCSSSVILLVPGAPSSQSC